VLKPGVDLRLDQMCRSSGSCVLPDNVTISAVKGGETTNGILFPLRPPPHAGVGEIV